MKKTTAAIIVKDRQILLIKRNRKPFKDYWALPGGHINKRESSKEAIIRETKEETNLKIKPRFLMECIEIFKRLRWYANVYVFTGPARGIIKFDKKEIKDIKLFPLNKLPKLAFNHEEIIKKYRKSN